MPVKIRCTSCRKTLNVPDRARGKTVRCPSCQTKLRIPAGTKTPREAVGAERLDSTAFLANLDLSQVEDTKSRVCPRCGFEVDLDDVECPQCGVDIETGVLSASARRQRQRKGPDTSEFYSSARKESWRFLKKHKDMAVRLAASWIVFSLISGFCAYWIARSTTAPPQAFWIFSALVTAMVAPGFTWFLHVSIIRETLAKKNKIKKLKSDLFTNVALGIKLLAWLAFFSLPFQLIAGLFAAVFWFFGAKIVAYVCIGLGFVAALCLYPIAMPHMAMPVTYRGWLPTTALGTFLEIPRPTLYSCGVCFVSMLPALAGIGVIGGVFADDLVGFYGDAKFRSRIAYAETFDTPKGESTPQEILELREETPPPLDLMELIPSVLVWVATCFAFGFAAVFNMRVNGHFAVYFKRELNLITQEKETTYVPKARPSEEGEEKEESTVATVFVLAVLTLVGAIIMGVQNNQPVLFMLVGVMGFLSWLPVAGLWRIFEKAKEPGWATLVPFQRELVLARIAGKPSWWGLLMYLPVVGLVVWILISLGIAEQFGKSSGFGIGLALLPFVFLCVLGFGSNYKYGPQAA